MWKWIILLLFSVFAVYISIIFGYKTKLIDNPSSEKIHKITIPRTGGMGIFFAFFLGIILFGDPFNIYETLFLISIFLIGFVDDMISIPQKIKFSIEIGLAIILGIVNPWKFIDIFVINILFSTFYLVGSINALNEVDGMDGLAGGVVLISCLFLSYLFMDIPLVVAIACLGFIIWNFHPAKVFMGDGGALFLGAFVGIISLKILNSNPNISTLIALIFIYSIPIYDSFLTVIRRFYSRSSIFKPDLYHFYNKLYNITGNYIGTVIIIYIFAIVFSLIGLYLYKMPPIWSIIIGSSIWMLLTYVGYRLGFIIDYKSKKT